MLIGSIYRVRLLLHQGGGKRAKPIHPPQSARVFLIQRRRPCIQRTTWAPKQQILDCAMEELERTGVQGLSMRAVAGKAGVTPMAIYRHFENRDDLLTALGEEAFAEWKRRIDAIRTQDPIDWLRKGARAYVKFAIDEPARFDACFVLRTRVQRLYPDDFRARKSAVATMVVARVEAAQAEGRIAPGDPLEIGLLFWSALHGLAMLNRSGRFAMKRASFLALCARLTEQVLDGLSAQSHRGRRNQ